MMTVEKVLFRSVAEHAAALAAGEYTAVRLTRAYLERIQERNGEINAYLYVDGAGALAAAEESDVRRLRGECRGVLDGIPYALKDNFAAKGLPMTCGSKILGGYVSPYDATVVARLKASGAILLGKNNMDEFAMGSSGEYSAYGVTKNPYDRTRVVGGSSSGSAATVADGMAAFALGSDTGGSVRQPAAFCGVYGLKPTYGVLSRYGLASMASSLDCVGILARTAEDCGLLLDVLAGQDAHDATSVVYAPKSVQALDHVLRLGVISFDGVGGIDEEIKAASARAVERLTACGAVAETVELPLPDEALAAYTVLSSTEAASNLARYDGVRYGRRSARSETLSALYENSRGEGLGAEVKRRILFGTDMLVRGNREVYYLRALRVREAVRRQMEALSERYDVLISPAAPTAAFGLGSTPSPDALYCADMCTVYANLAGVPALSVPFGVNAAGLPLAVQLTARRCGENLLLAAARLLCDGEVK
ncbi:MAG: Asp-tRNA(Asn)/Glu-tRNA(Gln) amidotransferase subunit GatA [Clostridia bacterium]|nr:Asp-tRNA(Asn)/Glu-tRNA(Gln) amidotransferase subunit GatA [Clostridia bacterium]